MHSDDSMVENDKRPLFLVPEERQYLNLSLVTKRGISLYIVGQQSHPFHRSKYMIIQMFTLQAK